MTVRPGQPASKSSVSKVWLCVPPSASHFPCVLFSSLGLCLAAAQGPAGEHTGEPLKDSPSSVFMREVTPSPRGTEWWNPRHRAGQVGILVAREGGCCEDPPGVCLEGAVQGSLLLGLSRLHVWRFALNPLRCTSLCCQ